MAATGASSVAGQQRKRGGAAAGSGSRAAGGSMAAGGRGPGKRYMGRGAGHVKRKWRPDQKQKVFEGSARAGQGFALWRKNKVQLDYKKLQRKQKASNAQAVLYSDHYPDHLKHLYLAEEERLKREEKRRKPANLPPEPAGEEPEVIPRKRVKKTSNQKAKEEYERVKLKRAKKREEAENNRKKREEALKRHKQKRMETYKVLCSKTKKGQPNFNVQMDHLLKKIQGTS